MRPRAPVITFLCPNKGVGKAPSFTPTQDSSGRRRDGASAPAPFQPYGASHALRDTGQSDRRLAIAHGKLAQGGARLVVGESTPVEPRGRISPSDSGLWKDVTRADRQASIVVPWAGGSANNISAGGQSGGWPEDVVSS
ncbi:hypothetical protein S40293_00265 [Stachybotrys chartarum IBT 40293]|nr:hypothetical protein S40293_00265 [Stachybotrys chartarum IBT 40293]